MVLEFPSQVSKTGSDVVSWHKNPQDPASPCVISKQETAGRHEDAYHDGGCGGAGDIIWLTPAHGDRHGGRIEAVKPGFAMRPCRGRGRVSKGRRVGIVSVDGKVAEGARGRPFVEAPAVERGSGLNAVLCCAVVRYGGSRVGAEVEADVESRTVHSKHGLQGRAGPGRWAGSIMNEVDWVNGPDGEREGPFDLRERKARL